MTKTEQDQILKEAVQINTKTEREDPLSKEQEELLLRETLLKERKERLEAMEAETLRKEKELKEKEKAKKQVPLRLASSLWEELAAWAEEDFRSINGQIEYLLAECVRNRKKHS